MKRKTKQHAYDKAVSLVSGDERGHKATSCRIGQLSGNKRNPCYFFFFKASVEEGTSVVCTLKKFPH